MFIVLTAINPHGPARTFFYQPSTIEVGFDMVSRIAGQDPTLIKVELMDQGYCVALPIEAFDGAPLAVSIQGLEQQWIRLLEQPLQHIEHATRQEFSNWAHQQVYQCEKRITDISQLIDVFSKLIHETENAFSFRESSLRKVDHFRFMLKRYELKRVKAFTTYALAVKRINKLTDQ